MPPFGSGRVLPLVGAHHKPGAVAGRDHVDLVDIAAPDDWRDIGNGGAVVGAHYVARERAVG